MSYEDDDEEICGKCEWPLDACECTEFGYSTLPPWFARGIKMHPQKDKTDWTSVWPEIDNNNLDPVRSAAEFYLLEGMASASLHPITGLSLTPIKAKGENADQEFFYQYGIKKNQQAAFVKARDEHIREQREADPVYELQWIMGEADRELDTLVDYLDTSLVAYSHMAISGELRHHAAFKVGGTRDAAWCAWRPMYDAIGNDILQDAAKLFYEFEGSGYGGPPWANCAETLWARLEGRLGPDGPEGRINKRMFIDRFWTLEHNGGCFLNKIHWNSGCGQSYGYIQTLLNAHGANPTDVETLLDVSSKKVLTLYSRYVTSMNAIRAARGMEPIVDIVADALRTVMVCDGCSSNPEHGHYQHCGIMNNKEHYKFGWDADTNEPIGSWYTDHKKKKLGHGTTKKKWTASATEVLPYDKFGVLSIKGETPVKLTLDYVGDASEMSGHFSGATIVLFEGTLEDIMAGKADFVMGDQLKPLCPKEPWHIGYALTLHDASITAGTIANEVLHYYAKNSEGKQSISKVWNETTDVAAYVMKKNEGLVIT